MKQRILAFFCAALLVLSFASCAKQPAQEPESETQTSAAGDDKTQKTMVTLPYTSADSLNPFETKSRVNLDIAGLLFDPLYQIDASFEAVPVLALSAENEGESLTVTLRNDVHFPKGELLTARDVVYSFQCAKESPMFSARLENIFSASAVSDDAVRFTLLSPDRFAVKPATRKCQPARVASFIKQKKTAQCVCCAMRRPPRLTISPFCRSRCMTFVKQPTRCRLWRSASSAAFCSIRQSRPWKRSAERWKRYT